MGFTKFFYAPAFDVLCRSGCVTHLCSIIPVGSLQENIGYYLLNREKKLKSATQVKLNSSNVFGSKKFQHVIA